VYYTHDGNKNVSDVIVSNGEVAAHYDYAPFGAVSVHTGVLAAVNPFRFSSECVDDALRLVYYNFRHYEPVVGRWLRRDPIGENGGLNNYSFLHNDILRLSDYLGEYCSVCGYVDYSAWSMGVRAGSVFRDCRKEPSIWDQFGSNSNPFHQEMYFQTRYSQLLVVAKQSFSARIMQRIDCKSATVEIKAGEDMYEYHAGDTYFPFIPCSGGDVYEGQEPQGWYERYCGLGNFTLKIDKSVIVAYYGDCKDCKRKFRWYTTMYILDELGVSRNDRWPVSWLQPFALARIVIRAKWTIDGEGECKCDKQ
jgi:RHS repeat-associated protein